jgi:hypothetical protein
MRSLIDYLQEVTRTYEFRIKFANVDPNDKLQKLEEVLKTYGLESITALKRIPTAPSLDFPNFGPTDVHQVDAVLSYPFNTDTLRAVVSEMTKIPAANIVVVPRNHPEELWRNGEGELREYVKGEAILDKPIEEEREAGALAADASAAYRDARVIQKDGVSTAEWEKQGTEKAKTLNDFPVNTKSVMSTQNKIPDPVRGAK